MNRLFSSIINIRSLLAAIGIIAIVVIGVVVPFRYTDAQSYACGDSFCMSNKTLCDAICLTTGGGTCSEVPSCTDSGIAQGKNNTNELFLGGTLGIIALIPTIFWYVALYILEILLSALLFISSYILDTLFVYNIILNPNNMPAVVAGWIIVRDVVNALFILLVLWVAITIIFDLEKYGGKSALVKIIVVALLINFSLALTGAVFGFANALAKPFRDAIAPGEGDVAAVIVNAVNFQNITNTIANSDFDKYAAELDAGKTNCGFGSLTDAATQANLDASYGLKGGCVLAKGAITLASVFANPNFIYGFNTVNFLWDDAVELAIINLFLFLIVITFAATAILLMARVIAMIFLGVLAPAAFFVSLVPVGKIRGLWTRWIEALFCWAFFLPLFYFLFWISLTILDTMTKANQVAIKSASFASNIMAIIPLIVFLGLLWTAMGLGKKLGCEGAKQAIDLGKAAGAIGLAVGAAVATGGLSAVGGAALKSGVAQKALTATRNVPIVGAATRPLREKTQKMMAEDKDKIRRRAGELERYGPTYLAGEYKNIKDGKEKTAYALALARQNKLTQLGSSDIQNALTISQQYGLREEVLKGVPHLATPQYVSGLPQNATNTDAITKVLKDIKDKWRIPESAYGKDSPHRDATAEAMLRVATPNDFNQIAQNNQELKSVLQEFINKKENTDRVKQAVNPQQWQDMIDYLSGTIAQSIGPKLGYVLPEHMNPTRTT